MIVEAMRILDERKDGFDGVDHVKQRHIFVQLFEMFVKDVARRRPQEHLDLSLRVDRGCTFSFSEWRRADL